MLKPLKRTHNTFVARFLSLAIFFLCVNHAAIAQDDEGKVIEEDNITIPGGQYFQDRQEEYPVTNRQIPGSAIQKMRDDDDFWYANALFKKKGSQKSALNETNEQRTKRILNEKQMRDRENSYKYDESRDESTPVTKQPWFQFLLWIVIIVGFVIVIILYLNSSNVKLFRKKISKTNIEEEELSTEDIFAINYQKEIDKAAASGNYRLAIRLMFLRVLRNMTDNNIIRYKQDKTNLDYLMELHPTVYYKNFFRITRSYEYAWYGLFPVSEEAYVLIRKDFDQFEKELART